MRNQQYNKTNGPNEKEGPSNCGYRILRHLDEVVILSVQAQKAKYWSQTAPKRALMNQDVTPECKRSKPKRNSKNLIEHIIDRSVIPASQKIDRSSILWVCLGSILGVLPPKKI